MELEEILLGDGGPLLGKGGDDGGSDDRKEVVFKISGITCDKCVRLITECLKDMEGILQALVSRGQCYHVSSSYI